MWKVHNSEHIKLDLVTEFGLQKLQPNIGVIDILVCTRQIQTESLSS